MDTVFLQIHLHDKINDQLLHIIINPTSAYLPGLDGEPGLLLEFEDLVPDLAQLRPHTLQVLQLLQGHQHTFLARTQLACRSR